MSSSCSRLTVNVSAQGREAGRDYLACLAVMMLAGLAATWLWVAAAPIAFLDSEYPFWKAKLSLLRGCDIGSILVVGDSRAATDIVPRVLPGKATNLAIGGAQPVESYFAVKHALECPSPPQRVVISHSIGHFARPDTFWNRSVRFGFLGYDDLQDIYATSRRLNDFSVYGANDDGLPPAFRHWLYAVRFPAPYFASLVRSGLFLRYWDNRAALTRALDERGHYFFGTEAGSDTVTSEARLRVFQPTPVVDHYFDAMLALLHQRGIPVDFVTAPINEATSSEMDPNVRKNFSEYLQSYAERYPNLRIIGETIPSWPNKFFGDTFLHMNPSGADRFSRRLASCLRDGPHTGSCDLQWNPEIQTGSLER